jgi:hypothetical protein
LVSHAKRREDYGVREHGAEGEEIALTKARGSNGGWRKLRNGEHHNLYSSPKIIRVMKSRRMR